MPNSVLILTAGGRAQADAPGAARSSAAPDPLSGEGLLASAGPDGMMLLCFVLAVVALVAVCNVVSLRREARGSARKARRRGDAMRELLRSMRMAESMAGIGVWQYDCLTQAQLWSEGLKRLFGLDPDAAMCAGDAETVLFVNDIDLVGTIRRHRDRLEPFTFRFDLHGPGDAARTIEVQACNLRNAENAVVRVVAVMREMSDEVALEETVELSWRDPRSGFPPGPAPAPCSPPILRREPRPVEIDRLTGLADRRLLMRELDRYVLEARLSLKPLVLVMFDIDHFKRVNDRHGRDGGDLVLKNVARIAREQARETDLVGRLGGEEFGWIIPQATDGMARVMTERLRQAIARESGAGAIAPVTISLGFASIHTGDTALTLFARADAALYDAKHSGRNRVRVAA